MVLEELIQKYKITDEQIKKNALKEDYGSMKCSAKELIGNTIFKENFKQLFPKAESVKKCSSKRKQLAGIDFFVINDDYSDLNIDIKCCIGDDYDMKIDDYIHHEDFKEVKGVPVEISQNGDFTNTEDKETDYMVYIICDKDGINIYMFYYNDISLLLSNKEFWGPKYAIHTSFNGTGRYYKLPVSYAMKTIKVS